MALGTVHVIGRLLLVSTICCLLATSVDAQYFGRNKVQYESFDFQVLETEHFDVYFYPEEREGALMAARLAERWYARLSTFLGHELNGRQPLLLYASHPDFEQTNALAGMLGEGTGGATEALKRRIVLPLAGALAETDHVVGHELVHAFQYDITGEGGLVADVPAVARLPLWFVEGMAEYLSIGPVAPQTAMWMRDATDRDDLPDLGDLAGGRYFPYRYGHSLLAFIAGTYGEDTIGNLLRAPGRRGTIETAMQGVLEADPDSTISAWHRALRDSYGPLQEPLHSASEYGTRIMGDPDDDERIQVGPVVSPDGRKALLFSERTRFAVNLFVIEVSTGKVIRRLSESEVDPHLESLLFIQSAGSWAPDSRRVIFPAISRGRPVLVIMDSETGKSIREIRFPEFGEIYSPVWSPDGRYVAFSALVGGFTDIFVYDLETDQLERWTSDAYADLQPAWSPDGSRLALTTDRFTTDLEQLSVGSYEIAVVDVPATRSADDPPATAGNGTQNHLIDRTLQVEIARLPGKGKKQHNPQWSPDGESLYFIANPNGVSNLCKADATTGELVQLTDIDTGVSGITEMSPAFSVSETGVALFTAFENRGYGVFRIDDIDALVPGASAPGATSSAEGVEDPLATLPPFQRDSSRLAELLADQSLGRDSISQVRERDYSPRLSLDAIGQPFIAAGADRSGAFFGGGVSIYFSDMLGNRNLALAVEGQTGTGFDSFGGALSYINLAHRWNWGAALQQIPYLSGGFESGFVITPNDTIYVERELRVSQTNRSILGLASYAISRAKRIDLSASADWITFGREESILEVDANDGRVLVDETRELDAPGALGLGRVSGAFVHDTSLFGGTSPILGERYRLELSPTFGSIRYYGALADYRRYEMPIRPITLAGRVLYYGRHGEGSADDRLSTLFLGSQGLLRGYDIDTFSAEELSSDNDEDVFDRLIGTRLAVANLEVRVPPFALLGLGAPYGGPLPIELGAFYDTGVAWDSRAATDPTFLGGDRALVRSYGAVGRINLFGYVVVEADYVKPVDRPDDSWRWQFGLRAGF
jgi:WD40 repeat protein